MPKTNRILLLACSKEKRPLRGPVEAYKLYAGPLWKSWAKLIVENDKRLKRDRRELPLCIALSARYGFILEGERIESYDEELTLAQATKIVRSPVLRAALDKQTSFPMPTEIFLAGGKLYRQTMQRAIWELNRPEIAIREPLGPRGIGDIRADMIRWLEASPLLHPQQGNLLRA